MGNRRGSLIASSRAVLLAVALVLVLAACDTGLQPATSPALTVPSGTPSQATTPATPQPPPVAVEPSPTPSGQPPTPVEGPVGGWWRVQERPRIQAPDALVAALDRQAFAVFRIDPGCAEDPCDTVAVTVLTPTYAVVLGEFALRLDGLVYESDRTGVTTGPCVAPDGTTVAGGAEVTERVRLWLEEVGRAGTAVTSLELRGERLVRGEPVDAGTVAGCEPWEARYDLQGSPTGAPANPDAEPTPDTTTVTDATLVDRPDLRPKVKGATVDFFSVRGGTVAAIAESVANGGLKACGAINYEWYEGDTRPAGCMKTEWDAFRVASITRADGSCRLDVRRIKAAYEVELPRWTSPDRVPEPLADWWRETVDFIRDHEAGHVKIARSWVAKLPDLLDGKPCSRLQRIVTKWASGLNEAQQAYDRREYTEPWPEPPAGY